MQENKWPKIIPELSAEYQIARERFMKLWLETLPKRYNAVEKFNQTFAIKEKPGTWQRTLEIGSGLGEHIRYEDLSNQEYYALELREELADKIKKSFPEVKTIVADCQKKTDLPDNYFDRVLAVHVLEHLPNLPAALSEIKRILKPSGQFCICIPCEGGFAYSLARNISARRLFENEFHMKYDPIVACEHVNNPGEIIQELKALFDIKKKVYFPLHIPLIWINLIIGILCHPRKDTA